MSPFYAKMDSQLKKYYFYLDGVCFNLYHQARLNIASIVLFQLFQLFIYILILR